jgi:hypothetical protein
MRHPQGQDSDLCQPCPAGAGPPWRGLYRSWLQRFPPAIGAKALSPLLWQGPSPLPQRHADPRPAGGKAPGQRPSRPWRALASVGAGGTGLGGNVPRGRGKRRAFPVPARTKTLFPPGSVLGHFGEPVLAGRYLFRRRAERVITEPVRGIAVAPDMPGGLEAAPDPGKLDTARSDVSV